MSSLGVDEKNLTKTHGPCPACGGKDRFRFDDKDGRGTFYCNQCGAGDGFRLVELVHGWTAKQSLQAVASALGTMAKAGHIPSIASQRKVSPELQESKDKVIEKLKRIWHESVTVKPGNPGWIYLTQTRSIPLASIPQTVRYHGALAYWETGKDGKPRNRGKHPALVFTVHSSEGNPVGLRFIYLTPTGHKLPNLEPKKLRVIEPGAAAGGAIRFGEPNDTLAVSEGLETGLAIQAAKNIPVWAAGSAVLMEKLIVPAHVKTVLIFADNDLNNCGQSAANALAFRLRSENKAVGIYIPEEPGADWLDILFGDNSHE